MSDEVKVEQPKTRKRKKYIPVKLIASKDKAIIVEWLEGEVTKRGILPNKTEIKSNKIEEGVLNTAIDYGIPFDEFESIEFDSTVLTNELHKKGIWTYQDLLDNPRIVSQTLLVVIKATRDNLLKFAKEFENTK